MTVSSSGMLMGLLGVFMSGGVVAFFMMLRRGPMSSRGMVMMLGGFGVFVFRHKNPFTR